MSAADTAEAVFYRAVAAADAAHAAHGAALRAVYEAARAEGEAAGAADADQYRAFAASVACAVHPGDVGAIIANHLDVVDLPELLAHLRERLAQARAEGEAAGRAAELRLREVGQILIAEIGAAGPTFTEDVARAAVARIQAAEAEAERLRSAIAETLRLADIYAGVAAHNAEAEPETAGEAWRSAGAATVRELRRALGGAA